MPVKRSMPPPRKSDPLDDLLLPAGSFAKKCAHGERASTQGEKMMSAALLVLLAERESYAWLLREKDSLLERQQQRNAVYMGALEEELGAAGVERVKAYLRLSQRTGLVNA